MARTSKLAIAYQEVIAGYANELTIRQLASIHEVSPGTIRNCLIAHGISLRKRGRRVTPKKTATEKWLDKNTSF